MKLNFGCGPVVAPGWVNLDREYYPGIDRQADLLKGLAYDDETFDCIVANHSLQMVEYHDLVSAVSELWRVLKRGGVLRLIVPDIERAFSAFHTQRPEHFLVSDDVEPSLDGKLCAYITQCSSTRSVFTGPWLVELCERSGFARALIVTPEFTLCDDDTIRELDSRPDESVFVEAVR